MLFNGLLEELCKVYWPIVYGFVRRQVGETESAADLTQGFFARLLEKTWLAQADESRGRFRSFLRAACKHYVSNERQHAAAQKRGGGWRPIDAELAALDARVLQGASAPLAIDAMFDREWAVALLDRAAERMATRYRADGKAALHDRLHGFLAGAPRGDSYTAAGQDLGMSEAAVRMAVTRLRQSYREALRDEIAPTVASPVDVDDEIQSLFAIFAK